VDTRNSQKKSPRSSAKSKQDSGGHRDDSRPPFHRPDSEDDEQFMDYSMDHVARVRRAREAAQRKMESFGDASEYDITIIRGQLRPEPSPPPAQPALNFEGSESAERKEKE